jgi:hypothetical protein
VVEARWKREGGREGEGRCGYISPQCHGRSHTTTIKRTCGVVGERRVLLDVKGAEGDLAALDMDLRAPAVPLDGRHAQVVVLRTQDRE